MINKSDNFINTFWRFAPLAVGLIWTISYIFQFFPGDVQSYENLIITPGRLYIPITLIGIMVLSSIFFPFNFIYMVYFAGFLGCCC